MISSSLPAAGCMRWGKWGAHFSTGEYYRLITECISQGITAFDHADIYGDYTTEEEFGNALRTDKGLRAQIQIITKCGICRPCENRPGYGIKSYDVSARHIIASAERSLQNFNTDYLDLLLIHRPSPLLNPHEVAEAVELLKKDGKILQFGVSNFLPHQVNMLSKFIKIEYNQVEISIISAAPFINGILDNCLENGIVPMAWAPLGGGIVSDDSHPHFRAITKEAEQLAEKYNTGINQVLVAFLLAHPSGIIPVVGTTKMERLIQSKEAFSVRLSREDWFRLYEASRGEEVA